MKTCYYAVLAVPRDATDAAVRKAYFRWALQLHPGTTTRRRRRRRKEVDDVDDVHDC